MKQSTAGASRLSYLDGFRGFACLLVFLYHYDLNFGIRPYVIWGFTGVHLFFVLSGFLLFQPFLKAMSSGGKFPTLSKYYFRRFIRIFPPFIVSLGLYVAIRIAMHNNVPSSSNILAHALLLSNYNSPSLWYSIDPVYWSLSIEMQFYVVLPLICYLFYRLPFPTPEKRCLTCVAAFAGLGLLARGAEILFWRSHGAASNDVMFRSIFSYLDMFAIGMLIATLRLPTLATVLRPRVRFGALILVGTAVTIATNLWCCRANYGHWLETPDFLYGLLFPALTCIGWGLLILSNILFEERSFPFFNRGFFVWVGQISYTVYLYHLGIQFVYLRYGHVGSHFSNWDVKNVVDALVSLPIVLITSAGLYWLVERPCLNWLSRPSSRQT